MKPGMFPLRAGAMSHSRTPGFAMLAFWAWRDISLRRWAWASAIALTFFAAHVAGVLPGALALVGPPRAGWSVVKTFGLAVIYLVVAYCFLVGIGMAEVGTRERLPPVRRYIAAAVVACVGASLAIVVLYILVPSIGPQPEGWDLSRDRHRLFGWFVWCLANFGLCGSLALAVYVRLRSARLAREAFNAAEMDRVSATREVLASRLAAMQARVEPGFLLGTLAQVEALYDRDPQAGDRMLDSLIAYLRAALPQLRTQTSTLKQETQLAESYLRIMQIRMGSRLDVRVDIRGDLGDCEFPPMMLLPLVEDALRDGLEPLPHGGTIAIAADVAGDRLRVRVSDDGLPRVATPSNDAAVSALHERLQGLYGSTASLTLSANVPQGVVAVIEVPLETARDPR